MKIIELIIENVKRIKAVTIKPKSNMVVIGGRNDQGKTTALDCISYLFEGKGAICDKPVRKGEKKAIIIGKLDTLDITRTFTASGGSTLKVASKEGAAYPSPQTILDKIKGKLTFDPLEFSRMDSTKQLETLKALVGLDFTALDEKRARIYAERTAQNREEKRLATLIGEMPFHENVPPEEVSIGDLLVKLDLMKKQNEIIEERQGEIEEVKENIQLTKKAIEEEKENLVAFEKAYSELTGTAKADVIQDIEPIQEQVRNAESINAAVRSNRERAVDVKALADQRELVVKLTSNINDIDTEKEEALQAATFPVPGLSFDDNGVLFEGIPLEQAGSASRLDVSTAMAIAMNPKLRVLLIRDASLLDGDNLRKMGKRADAADCQIWLERVGDGKEVSVIIEDGEVVQK